MKKVLLSAVLCFCAIMIFAQSKSKMTAHTVVKGETLYSISKKYHVTIDAIEKANKSISGDMKIKPGQSINIPGAAAKPAATATVTKKDTGQKATPKSSVIKPKATPPTAAARPGTAPATVTDGASTHTIVKGESLYSLAKTYGVSVSQLRSANNMDENSKLKIGQKLNIPSKNPEAMYQSAPTAAKPEQKTTTKSKEDSNTGPGREYIPSDNPPVESSKQSEQKAIDKKDEEPSKPMVPAVKVTEEKPTAPVATDKPKEITTKEEKAPEVKEPRSMPAETMKNTNVSPSEYSSVFDQGASSGKKKVVYRGIGSFLKSDNPGNQFLALYNYADMGSILKVTNLMSKQAIYVKVIGRVPAADTQNEIILKVSAEAASQLKVSEEKFLVEVTGYTGQ